MWKTIVEPEKPKMTICRLCIACWIPKATKTLGVCNNVILIAFLLFHERASMLLNKNFACIFKFNL